MKTTPIPGQKNPASRFYIHSILFSLLALVSVQGMAAPQNPSAAGQSAITRLAQPERPRIQLAILLDTSSSMNGLIDQARQQLWQVVDEFSRLHKSGNSPRLEVAVYEYGNSSLSAKNGYIRQVSALTAELDQVSEALFSLRTGGGDEYCGYVIQSAVDDLQWSQSAQDIKTIFIAGNEPFSQGPVPFRQAINKARTRGITVNTIHAGEYNEGANSGWKDGALLAGGNYMSINQDQKVVHIAAPQDKQIAQLNASLNKTYIPYGAEGRKKVLRQQQQDAMSSNISAGLLAKRAKTKASSMYRNSNWDLVDAIETGDISLDDVEKEQLPEEMKTMNKEQRTRYVQARTGERKRIKKKIAELAKARDAYVAGKKRHSAEKDNTLDKALISAVRKEAKKKKFDLKTH